MTSRDFCYWLQGFLEIAGPTSGVSQEQTETIQRHLAMVFQHEIDPSFGGPEKQAQLNKTHVPPTATMSGGKPLYRC